jgi:hypothetical protein
MWPLGLMTAVTGPTGDAERVGALIRLAWAVSLALAALAWLRVLATEAAPSDRGASAPDSAHDGSAGTFGIESTDRVGDWPDRVPMAAIAAVIVVAGLFLMVFVPIADPAATAATTRTGARELDDPLRAQGSAVYARDACAACHTQRVVAGDAGGGLGPFTGRGDYPPGYPAHAGVRRGGPDLAWVGDRYPSEALMAERLSVHAPGGAAVPHVWLFGGANPEANALSAYLSGLRSGGAP